MIKITHKILLVAAILIMPIVARADGMVQLASNQGASIQAGQSIEAKIVTGPITGTYHKFGLDLAGLLKSDGMDLNVESSNGSIDNLSKLSEGSGVRLGIVQSDVLSFLEASATSSGESRKAAQNLRMLFPLYQEEVHIVANKSIKDFDDLKDKKIAVGQTGSGSWLTVMNLLTKTNITPYAVFRLPPDEGLVSVLRGKVDAMIYVAGKPVKLFSNLTKLAEHPEYSSMLNNVHFVPVTNPKILEEYQVAALTTRDYKFIQEDVQTISVSALLVSYSDSDQDAVAGSKHCVAMGRIIDTLSTNLDKERRNMHPKWREVSLDAQLTSWRRDPCAIANSSGARLENELLNVLKRGHL